MKLWTAPLMTLPCVARLTAGVVLIAIQACASSRFADIGREPTMADWSVLEDELRRDKIEGQKFDSHHPLVGKVVGVAARELIADGYVCEIGYLDLPKPPKGDGRGFFVRTPLLFCERKSPVPGDFCVERHVVLDVAWPDNNVGLSVLERQMEEVVVTQRTFRCDTSGDVAIRLRKRREGRQE